MLLCLFVFFLHEHLFSISQLLPPMFMKLLFQTFSMLYENSITNNSDKNLNLLEIHANNMKIKFDIFSPEQYFLIEG